MYGIIYMTINKVNGKKYIGKHKCNSEEYDGYLGSGKILKLAFKKYGKDNFYRETIAIANNLEELNRLEKKYIKQYNAIEDNAFYNITSGGEGVDYETLPEETKQLIKEKAKINSEGENNPMYGKHHSEETRRKIANNRNMASYKTEKFRNTISNIVSGENNPMYGKHHSEESKKAMSEHHKGLNCGENNGNYGNKGELATNGTHYFCYEDEDHNILFKEFVSQREVLSWLGMRGHAGLDKAILSNSLYKGYYWEKGQRGSK